MSAPNHAGSNGDDRSNNNSTEKTVAKTAGFVVFSGIAMSILKALNPYNNQNNNNNDTIKSSVESVSVSPPLQLIQESKAPPPPPPFPEPVKKSMSAFDEPSSLPSSSRTIEIVKGDTLWGLSREYGVSIDALKEANGLTGDTIYAGKKLVIP